jgi:hypothetical protein
LYLEHALASSLFFHSGHHFHKKWKGKRYMYI